MNEKPWSLGPFQRFLIHLAGADPGVFQKLGPSGRSEASDFLKLGITVLVPFVLALAAGSFTLYTIQDDPKNFLVALFFGIVWALIILGIDVAIMSQLLKAVDLPPPESAVRGYRWETPAPRPVRKKGWGRICLPILRVVMAAALGLFMSHCLVLAIFKGRVQQQMEHVRASLQEGVDDRFLARIVAEEKQLAEAQRISNIVDRDTFYAGYQKFMKSLTGGDDAVVLPGDAKGGSESNDPVLKPYAEAIRQASEEANARDSEKDNVFMEMSRLEGDQLQARRMLQDEGKGIVTTYSFNSRYFQKLPVKVTTGKQGPGSHTDLINQYIAGYDAERKTLETALRQADADLQLANKAVQDAKTKYRQAVDAQATAADQSARRVQEANEAAKKKVYAAAEEDIRKRSKDLEESLHRLQADYGVARGPVSGRSYDLMEQTEALHDLALGRNGASSTGSKQTLIFWLVILMLVCLMLIDLTPLLMKLMRQPGAYERWKAMAAEGSFLEEGGAPQNVSNRGVANRPGGRRAPPPPTGLPNNPNGSNGSNRANGR